MLFDLAGAAGLEDKRTKMGTGQHINATEDRAGVTLILHPYHKFSTLCKQSSMFSICIIVMHIALRSPKNKQFLVDGEDVVPEIHAVLDKVSMKNNKFSKKTKRPF